MKNFTIVLISAIFLQCSGGHRNTDEGMAHSNDSNLVAFQKKDSSVANDPSVRNYSDPTIDSMAAEALLDESDTLLLDALLKLDSDSAIIKRYGNNVIHKLEYSSEVEGSWPVSVLFAETDNEVWFEWRDTDNFRGLSAIKIYGKNSNWKTRAGVRLGTTRKELQQLNGKPFLFYYLGWNFEGVVQWSNGKLSNKNIYVRLAPNGSVDPRLYYPDAPELVASDSEAAQNSYLTVQSIELRKN